MRSEEEITEFLNDLDELGRTKFSGVTYEEGIGAALRWVLEEEDELECRKHSDQ